MAFVQNLPFICILISLFTGPLSSVLDGNQADVTTLFCEKKDEYELLLYRIQSTPGLCFPDEIWKFHLSKQPQEDSFFPGHYPQKKY